MSSNSSPRLFAGSAVVATLCAGSFFLGRHTTPTDGATASTSVIRSAMPSATAPAFPEERALHRISDAPPADAALEALHAAAVTPAAEETFLAALSALAATDPELALRHARAAATPRQRERYLHAVLRGWGGADALAASRWVLENVALDERRAAAEAIIQGAIARPEDAVGAIAFLRANDPSLAGDHGNALVAELAHAGRFDLASRVASDAPSEYRAWWLATAYGRWAAYQPDAALASLRDMAAPEVREAAAQGLIAGWAAGDPATLVARARNFPEDSLRASALAEGLRQWVSRDPGAASAWMDRLDPAPGLDSGAAALATTAALVSRRPEVAASWAESITDPGLRADTLLDFVRIWAETDPSAARDYAATSPALRPETRELALSSFASPSP